MTQTNSFGEFPTSGRPDMGLKIVYSAETGVGYDVVIADTRVAPDVPPFTLTDTDTGERHDFATILPIILINEGISKLVIDNDVDHSHSSLEQR